MSDSEFRLKRYDVANGELGPNSIEECREVFYSGDNNVHLLMHLQFRNSDGSDGEAFYESVNLIKRHNDEGNIRLLAHRFINLLRSIKNLPPVEELKIVESPIAE